MQRNYIFLGIPLFDGFSESELTELLNLIDAEFVLCDNERIIMHEGDRNPYIYVVLSGLAVGVKYDLYGREIIYNEMTAGSIFGDMLAVSANNESPVTIRAFTGTEILRFRFDRLVAFEEKSPVLRVRLLRNLTAELAQKYFNLQERINCLICPTLREKILGFLYNEAKKQKRLTFNIAMNREKLASYLNTDRSALSRELSNMKKDGIVDFYKNSFKLSELKGFKYDYQTVKK